MSLANCKRCGRLFTQAGSPFCQGCQSAQSQQKMEMYKYIQDHPGIFLNDLAATFSMPAKEVEALIFSGALGMANQLVKTQCARCKCEMSMVNRVGYFCYSCNTVVEKEAGVVKQSEEERRLDNIMHGLPALKKDVQETDRYEAPKTAALPEPSKSVPAAPPRPVHNRREPRGGGFGFKRISSE